MKFFKFLLQILAMGLCFVAGMTYEKNLLLKTAPNGEIDVNSGSIRNDDIIIDNTVPAEQQDVLDEGFSFDNNNNNGVVNDNVMSDDTNGMETSNIQSQDNSSQQIEEPIVNDQTIIINDIETIDNNAEGNNTAAQPEQLPDGGN